MGGRGTLVGAGVVVILAVGVVGGIAYLRHYHGIGSGNDHAESEPVASADDQKLAEQFAPILRLAGQSNGKPAEGLLPIDRPHYVGVADLKAEFKSGSPQSIPATTSVMANLPETPCRLMGQRCRYFLDIRGAQPSLLGAKPYVAVQKTAFEGAAVAPSVYWHVKHYPSGDTAVQYWFLYLFNDFADEHESDWEQITVHLDAEGGATAVFYSAHKLGHLKSADKGLLPHERPLVYVAYGSHANYFIPGTHKVQLKCKRKRGTIYQKCRKFGAEGYGDDHADGCGALLVPADENVAAPPPPVRCVARAATMPYRLELLRRPIFSGTYGRRNHFIYGLVPDRETFNDPRFREAWKDPLSYIAGAPAEPKPVR